LGCLFFRCEAAEGSQSNLVEGYEITTRLSGARNDSGKQLDESSNYKNLEAKNEDNK